MIKKLTIAQSQDLLKQPESGMGYQFIEASTRASSTRSKYLILNASIVIQDTPQINTVLRSVLKKEFNSLIIEASITELREINLVNSLTYLEARASQKQNSGAIHQPSETASGSEFFTRLSAYYDDKRIDKVNKRLLPGSFTTTHADYLYCKKSGINPVERYALPNDEEIKWAFHILPQKLEILQRGIVEPANNHRGGGIEAFFKYGTTNYTLKDIKSY